jgi:hypothetical protein
MSIIGFTTLDEAEIYASSIQLTSWNDATVDDKERALGSAYRLLLSYDNMYNYSTITQRLKDVQAELAIYLYQNRNSQSINNIQSGINSISIGNTSESYNNEMAKSLRKIPDYIFDMLSPLYIAGYTTVIHD